MTAQAGRERATVALAYALAETGGTDATLDAALTLVDHLVSQGAEWSAAADHVRKSLRQCCAMGCDASVIYDWSKIARGGSLDTLMAVGRFAAGIAARWDAPQGPDTGGRL